MSKMMDLLGYFLVVVGCSFFFAFIIIEAWIITDFSNQMKLLVGWISYSVLK
jgi:hypothetical protein